MATVNESLMSSLKLILFKASTRLMSTTIVSTVTAKDSTSKASRTITPIDDQYEYYTYGDLRLIHSINDDYFSASSITKALGSAKEPARWFKLRQTAEMLHGFSTAVEIGGSPLWYDNGKAGVPKHAYNIFMHRLLVPHFASWVSHVYAYKVSIILDDHFELQRKVTENRALEDKNKSLEQKVDELIQINRDQTNHLKHIETTITSKLDSLISNVAKLDGHITNNAFCRYIILLWTVDSDEDESLVTIKPFCGLIENRPKVPRSKILLEKEVSCSLDSFKAAIKKLQPIYITDIYYRTITVKRTLVNDFIVKLSAELIDINASVREMSANLSTMKESVNTIDQRTAKLESKVDSLNDRLTDIYSTFISNYGVSTDQLKRILEGRLNILYKRGTYPLKIDTDKQIAYISLLNGATKPLPSAIFRDRVLSRM